VCAGFKNLLGDLEREGQALLGAAAMRAAISAVVCL
jgi:hypothetical protein